ncbi:unnamed protein product [Caenorhabditis sp. 36 PRJEB53466]|nr:unnamed protein product [Caenorhabditis sp. 36 PRJEB53466]
MAAIEINSEIFNKYQKNGKLRLSTGYIQEALESDGYPGHDGIVQVLKGKADYGEQSGHHYTYRIRICDGLFQYNCLLSAEIDDQIQREAENLVEGTIIAITNFVIYHQGSGIKASFLITGYRILSRYHQTLCYPGTKSRSHSGNPDEHRGYRPNFQIDDVWPEAEHLAREFQENMTMPPAAKAPKRESGGVLEASRVRAAAPEPPRSRAAPEPPRSRAAPPAARRGTSKDGVIPIAAVTPYVGTIKIHGVVSRKDEIRTIPAKNMKILNFELTDTNGDTIRCTAFNETADSVYSTISENMSYYLTGGTVRAANKQFNNTGHDYELTLRNDTQIEAGGEVVAAPRLHIKRVPLSEIAGYCGQMIDVLVVVERIDQEPTRFTSKAGKELVKRELELIDESQAQARLTLWGDEAEKVIVDDYLQKVTAFKGVIPKEFNGGYSLSTGQGSRILAVPDIPGVSELYDWYMNQKPNIEVKLISQTSGGTGEAPRIIASLQDMQFGKDSEKGDFVTVKAMCTRINPGTALYKGCASDGCQKKVSENDGEYRCEKCNKSLSDFKWLYMMQLELSDETSQMYVTAFGETAAKIVGMAPSAAGKLKDDFPEEYNAVFERIQFVPKMWRLRCKMETYNEEVRQKMTVYGVEEVNQDRYIDNLQQLIAQMDEIKEENNGY